MRARYQLCDAYFFSIVNMSRGDDALSKLKKIQCLLGKVEGGIPPPPPPPRSPWKRKVLQHVVQLFGVFQPFLLSQFETKNGAETIGFMTILRMTIQQQGTILYDFLLL